jgi:hypothetical protein
VPAAVAAFCPRRRLVAAPHLVERPRLALAAPNATCSVKPRRRSDADESGKILKDLLQDPERSPEFYAFPRILRPGTARFGEAFAASQFEAESCRGAEASQHRAPPAHGGWRTPSRRCDGGPGRRGLRTNMVHGSQRWKRPCRCRRRRCGLGFRRAWWLCDARPSL